MLNPSPVDEAFERLGIGAPVPDETSYDEPPPYDCIPESADGEPDHEPAKVAIPITEESDSLEEWDAGDDTGLPPPREWLLGNQFCRKFLSGLLAPGATGKSALRLLQLMSLATGRPLTGQHVFKRSRVLLVSLEDDRDELRRRIAAACIHHGVERAELQGWLYCWTPKGIKLAEIKDNARQKGRLETLIRDKVKVRKIDLVALDPFIKLHALEENDNGAMDYVCDLLTKIAIDGNIAVVSKMKSTGFPAYDETIMNRIRGEWRYRPFQVNGKAVPVCTAVTFIYSQT